MEQPEWGPRLVKVVAEQVRYWRGKERRNMSAQALADECARLGWPIKRSVLSNLESGYRETITVPELFVLAQALRVPPLALLLPLGRADTVEILPGVEVTTTDALRWLRGEAWLSRPWIDDADGIPAIFAAHHDTIGRWAGYREEARDAAVKGDDQAAEHFERQVERTAEHLRSLRALMRARKLAPPPLPVQLAYLDDEVPA